MDYRFIHTPKTGGAGLNMESISTNGGKMPFRHYIEFEDDDTTKTFH